MAVYRLSAVEQFGVPLDERGMVPDGFSGLIGYMERFNVRPELVRPTDIVEITPPYWLDDVAPPAGLLPLDASEDENPFTNFRFFLTSQAAGRAVIDAVPLASPAESVAETLSSGSRTLISASAGVKTVFLPEHQSICIIGGQSTAHGMLPCLHEVFLDL